MTGNTALPKPSQDVVERFLTAAANGDNMAVMDFMDEYGAALIDQTNEQGLTALMLAVAKGCHTAVILLEGGASPNIESLGGDTALRFAVRHGDKDMAVLLLEKGADVNAVSSDKVTALREAAFCGYTETARVLLAYGASIDDDSDRNGYTALMSAVRGEQKDMVALLLEMGADIDLKSRDGKTALAMAEEYQNGEIATLLQAWSATQKQLREEAQRQSACAEREAWQRRSAALLELRMARLKQCRPVKPAFRKAP